MRSVRWSGAFAKIWTRPEPPKPPNPAVGAEGGGNESHRPQEIVDRNALEYLDVLERLVGHLRGRWRCGLSRNDGKRRQCHTRNGEEDAPGSRHSYCLKPPEAQTCSPS